MPFLWFGKKKAAPAGTHEPAVMPAAPDRAREALNFLEAGDFVAARLRILPMLREEGEDGIRRAMAPFLTQGVEEALAVLNKAVTGAPNPGLYHLLRGLFYESIGQMKSAVKDLDISTRLLGDPELLRVANDRLAHFAASES